MVWEHKLKVNHVNNEVSLKKSLSVKSQLFCYKVKQIFSNNIVHQQTMKTCTCLKYVDLLICTTETECWNNVKQSLQNYNASQTTYSNQSLGLLKCVIYDLQKIFHVCEREMSKEINPFYLKNCFFHYTYQYRILFKKQIKQRCQVSHTNIG